MDTAVQVAILIVLLWTGIWIRKYTKVTERLSDLQSRGLTLQEISRKQQEQALADSWRTAMEELWHVLDRTFGIWDQLRQGLHPLSEISLMPPVAESFFKKSPDPRATAHLTYIYQNVHQILWNMQQAQRLNLAAASSPDGAARSNANQAIPKYHGSAMWFIKNRHHVMIQRLRECEKLYFEYCASKGLRRDQELPAIIPLPDAERGNG